MAVIYFNIKTFDDAVQDMLKKSDAEYSKRFGSFDKNTQQHIVKGCYSYVTINESDHFSIKDRS